MLETLKRDVLDANRELSIRGLVILTWGNVSGIDRQAGLVVIKPSGVPYDRLSADSLVVIDLEGRVVEGALRPSSDLPSHLALYRAWPGIGGVTHTHSLRATFFAQASRPIPCLGTTHADHFCDAIPITRMLTDDEILGDYERRTGESIVACLSGFDPLRMPAALVSGHGPFTWGRTVREAVDNAQILEQVAEMAYGTLLLNPDVGALPANLHDKHFARKHGPRATYGQSG